MKVQCLRRSPIFNAVENELIRSEFLFHCLSCISFMYLIAYITISLSKSDDFTLWRNLFLGKKPLKCSFRDRKTRTTDTNGLRIFLACEVMSEKYTVDFEHIYSWCMTYVFRCFYTKYVLFQSCLLVKFLQSCVKILFLGSFVLTLRISFPLSLVCCSQYSEFYVGLIYE